MLEVRLSVCFAGARDEMPVSDVADCARRRADSAAGSHDRTSAGSCRRRVHRSHAVVCQVQLHRDAALSREEYARVAWEHR
eukprot:2276521-Rhodomonas_salina.1